MDNLPASLDAEKYLLGVIIRDAGVLPPDLNASDFHEPVHQDVASAIKQLNLEKVNVDEITLLQKLKAHDSPVTAYQVNDMVNTVGFNLYNPKWAESIKHTSKLRKLHSLAKQLQKLTEDPNVNPSDVSLMGLTALEAIQADGNNKAYLPQKMEISSLMEFDRHNDPDNLLGNRWLCKGGSMLFSGQAGSGKSALAMYAAVSWCLGKPFFGIKTVKPLRTLIIQAENDAGDIAESLQDLIAGLALSEFEKDNLKSNMFIYREAVATGESFGRLLKELIHMHQIDIAYVDPMLAFAGIDISDQQETSHFLRGIIQPILNETGIALVMVHHTGKPKSKADKEGQTVQDAAYNYLGSSELANFFRESSYLVRCAGDLPVFKFGLTKRRNRAGMLDYYGNFAGEIYIRHSPVKGMIKWDQCDRPEVVQAEEISEANKRSSKPKY
jgi:hypothetical protein